MSFALFDSDDPHVISLSVHDVISLASESTTRPATPAFARARLGQEVHSRYQKETAGRPGFRKEVAVSHETCIRGFTLRIDGRIDVVIERPEGTIIEEIKSVFLTAAEMSGLASGELSGWADQVRLYRWMWRMCGRGDADATLVLVSLLDGSSRIIPLAESGADLDRHICALLDRVVRKIEASLETAIRRRSLAARLRFPFPDYRLRQDDLAKTIQSTVRTGGTLIVEAPTGLGKTAASLWGSLASALVQNRKIFFVTAKGTQQKMALETVVKIREVSGLESEDPLRIVQIRAKEKMCLNDAMICDPEFCPYLKNYGERMAELDFPAKLLEHGIITGDLLLDKGHEHTLCPFEMSLDLAWESEAVVCDYNYAFDPGVMLAELADPDLAARSILIVDEAHALPARARGYRSPVLAASELEQLATNILSPRPEEPVRQGRLKRGAAREPGLFDSPLDRLVQSSAARELSASLMNLARLVRDPESCGVEDPGSRGDYIARPEADTFQTVMRRIEQAFLSYLVERKRQTVVRPHDPAVDAFAMTSKFIRTLTDAGNETRALWTPDSGGQISLHCLDASRFLSGRWDSVAASVLMSGTLSPMDYFREILGLPETAETIQLPSPFPSGNLTVEVDANLSTAWRDRTRTLPEIGRRLREFLSRPGNRVVYAPSFDYLASLHDATGPIPDKRFLFQTERMDDASRERFLRDLAAGSGDIVLWAVLGGIFAEGVDLPGEHLVGAAIIGPGLPKPDPERELEKSYWEEKSPGSGFEHAYLYPGMIRVIQSAGRLIRSETDKGELLLIDRRFGQRNYRRLFPSWWEAAEPGQEPE